MEQKKVVASTYYEQPGEFMPFVIELTFDYGEVGEMRRYSNSPAWEAAIDDLGIRWVDMMDDLRVMDDPRPDWHPSYPPESAEAAK